MTDALGAGAWYHGSPQRLSVLRKGGSITRNPALARAFSHRPSLVSQEDNGTIKHDGAQPGYLYVIGEEVQPTDIYPHPHPVNASRWEWLTRRELRVALLEETRVRDEERLTPADIAELRRRQDERGTSSFTE